MRSKETLVKFVRYDLTTFVLKNLRPLFDKYTVAGTEPDALVKSTTKILKKFVAFSENPNFKKRIDNTKTIKKMFNKTKI